jgi:hypothetical protein
VSLNQNQFGKHLRTATNVALTGAMAATTYVANSTHEAPTGGYGTRSIITGAEFDRTRAEQAGSNVPRWNRQLGKQFEGFRDIEKKPEGALNTHVVGVDSSNTAKVYPAQKAWNLNTDDERANNIWYVGYK